MNVKKFKTSCYKGGTYMTQTKADPRVLRTRRLIMDAFIELLDKKEFKYTTIKDITAEATVNRATFYYHFLDKYDLMEKTLKEDLMVKVTNEILGHEELDESTITDIFLSVTNFQNNLKTSCKRSFEDLQTTIEPIIMKELEEIFYQLMLERPIDSSNHSIRIAAVMLSWGIYGAAVDWQQNSALSRKEYIKWAMPYVTHGMNSLVS